MDSPDQVKKGRASLDVQGYSGTVHNEILAQVIKVADLWERMDMVVQAEWSVLLRNDMHNLIRISRIKKDLVSRIAREETVLGGLIACLIPKKSSVSCLSPSNLVQKGMQGVVARRFILHLRRREYYRQLVYVTNSRIAYWIHDRLGFCKELSSILSGARAKKSATYGPANRIKRRAMSGRDFDSAGFSKIRSESSKKKGMAIYISQAGSRL